MAKRKPESAGNAGCSPAALSEAQLDGLIYDPRTDVLITGQLFYNRAPGISVPRLRPAVCRAEPLAALSLGLQAFRKENAALTISRISWLSQCL